MGTSPRPTAAAAKRAPASAPPSAATGGKHAQSSRGGTIVADSFEAWSADGGVPHAAAGGPRRAASGAASVGTAPGKRAQVGSKAQAPKAAASAHEAETQPQSMPMTVSQWGTAEARPSLPPFGRAASRVCDGSWLDCWLAGPRTEPSCMGANPRPDSCTSHTSPPGRAHCAAACACTRQVERFPRAALPAATHHFTLGHAMQRRSRNSSRLRGTAPWRSSCASTRSSTRTSTGGCSCTLIASRTCCS